MKYKKSKMLPKWKKIIKHGDIKWIAEQLGISRHKTVKALNGEASTSIQAKMPGIYNELVKIRG